MKKTMRFLSCLLIMAMLVTMMAVPAFADEPSNGSITLQGSSSEALTGKTFEIYRIFNATISAGQSGSTANVAYQWINEGGTNLFYEFFYGTTAPEIPEASQQTKTIDEVVAYINAQDKAAPGVYMMGLGERLHKYAVDKGISAHKTISATEGAKSVKFEGLPYGYYLIYESTPGITGEDSAQVRSAVLLTTIEPDVKATLKNVNPTIVKKAKRLNDTLDGLSASVGENLYFYIEAFIPDFSYYNNPEPDNDVSDDFIFKIVDTPAEGFTLEKETDANKVYTVKIGSNTEAVEPGAETYQISYKEVDGKIAEVTFTFAPSFILKYPDRLLTIDYTAKLNENVSVGGYDPDAVAPKLKDYADVNTATMIFSADPYSDALKKISADARVYSFYVDVTKQAAIGNAALQGAEFTLHKMIDGAKWYATVKTIEESGETKLFINPETGAYELTGWVKDVTGYVPQKFVSQTNGHVKFAGLGKGTFYLTETKAPSGYNLPVNPEIAFAIDGSCTVGDGYLETLHVTTSVPSSASVKEGTINMIITNAAGEVLPTTGGMGTTLFTIGGLILMAGAAALLMARKKTEN